MSIGCPRAVHFAAHSRARYDYSTSSEFLHRMKPIQNVELWFYTRDDGLRDTIHPLVVRDGYVMTLMRIQIVEYHETWKVYTDL
jgi:hypothetical protein